MSTGKVADFFAEIKLIVDKGSFDQGDKALEKTGQKAQDTTKFFAGLKLAAAGFLALKGFQKIAGWVTDTADFAFETENLAAQLGINVESLQKLEYAGSRFGVTAQNLTVGLRHLSQGLQNASAKGTDSFSKALKEIGVNAADIKTKPLNEAFGVISNAIKNFQGPNKQGILGDLFGGRSGAKFLPLLEAGRDGIDAMGQKVKDLMTPKDLAAAADYKKAIDLIHGSFRGMRNTVVSALIPRLTELANKFQAWLDKNHDAIASKLEGWLNSIVTAVESVSEAMGYLFDHSSEAIALLGIVGVVGSIAFNSMLGPIAMVIAAVKILLDLWHDIVDAMSEALKDQQAMAPANAKAERERQHNKAVHGFAITDQEFASGKQTDFGETPLSARLLNFWGNNDGLAQHFGLDPNSDARGSADDFNPAMSKFKTAQADFFNEKPEYQKTWGNIGNAAAEGVNATTQTIIINANGVGLNELPGHIVKALQPVLNDTQSSFTNGKTQ